MKNKSLIAVFGIVFLFLALAPLVSANNINTWLYYGDGTTDAKTITQGESITAVMVATANGEELESQKLKLIGNSGTTLLASYGNSGELMDNGYTYLFSEDFTLSDTSGLSAGQYTLRFIAETSQTSESEYSELTLIVEENIVDTEAPVITILGNNPETVDLNSNYVDAGATAQDNVDGDLTSEIQVTNDVDTSAVGTYTVDYYVEDSAGNSASATRIVNVIDDTPVDENAPEVEIISPNNGQTYSNFVEDAVVSVDDEEDNLDYCEYSLNGGPNVGFNCIEADYEGPFQNYSQLKQDILNNITGLSTIEGTNELVVYATDEAGNTGSDTVMFIVDLDEDAPIITAENPVNNDVLEDEGLILEVSLNEEGSVMYSLDGEPNVTMTETSSGSLLFESDELDLGDGEYEVTYYATDEAGNTASLTIEFEIREPEDDNDSYSGYDSSDSGFSTQELAELAEDSDSEEQFPIIFEDELNWWQKFINWLCRLFGLEEIY